MKVRIGGAAVEYLGPNTGRVVSKSYDMPLAPALKCLLASNFTTLICGGWRSDELIVAQSYEDVIKEALGKLDISYAPSKADFEELMQGAAPTYKLPSGWVLHRAEEYVKSALAQGDLDPKVFCEKIGIKVVLKQNWGKHFTAPRPEAPDWFIQTLPVHQKFSHSILSEEAPGIIILAKEYYYWDTIRHHILISFDNPRETLVAIMGVGEIAAHKVFGALKKEGLSEPNEETLTAIEEWVQGQLLALGYRDDREWIVGPLASRNSLYRQLAMKSHAIGEFITYTHDMKKAPTLESLKEFFKTLDSDTLNSIGVGSLSSLRKEQALEAYVRYKLQTSDGPEGNLLQVSHRSIYADEAKSTEVKDMGMVIKAMAKTVDGLYREDNFEVPVDMREVINKRGITFLKLPDLFSLIKEES